MTRRTCNVKWFQSFGWIMQTFHLRRRNYLKESTLLLHLSWCSWILLQKQWEQWANPYPSTVEGAAAIPYCNPIRSKIIVGSENGFSNLLIILYQCDHSHSAVWIINTVGKWVFWKLDRPGGHLSSWYGWPVWQWSLKETYAIKRAMEMKFIAWNALLLLTCNRTKSFTGGFM